MERLARGRYLLVDVDGPLNPYYGFLSETEARVRDKRTRERIGRGFLRFSPEGKIVRFDQTLDPLCVDCLKEVVDATGAQLIANTAWWLEDLRNALAEFDPGLAKALVGRTGSKCENGVRRFLETNPSVCPEDFAIVDDEGFDDLNYEYRSRFIRAGGKTGLSPEHVLQIIVLFA